MDKMKDNVEKQYKEEEKKAIEREFSEFSTRLEEAKRQ